MAFALYRFVVRLYGLAIVIASSFNEKAKLWVQGRKNWQENLKSKMLAIGEADRFWFHCASYGEFEQGRPLIDGIKQAYPHTKIVLSFFSPSGYEAFKNWQGADVIVYLPLDTPSNAKTFLNLVKPSKTFIIKYEYWLCFLAELKEQQQSTYLISATFKKHQTFFKWYGGIFRNSLQSFTKLFVQDEASLKLLKKIITDNVILSGDTRVDRVLDIKAQSFENPSLQAFAANSFVLVAGSTWPEDEKFLVEAVKDLLQKNVKLIVAPHELTESSVKAVMQKFSAIDTTLSAYSSGIKPESKIVILDTMGMLNKVYRLGNMAYVGGGFGTGIHNILEPAVYGIPVAIAGAGHEKYNEAIHLMQLQVAFHCDTAQELQQKIVGFIENKSQVEMVQKNSQAYFEENKEVTKRIIKSL